MANDQMGNERRKYTTGISAYTDRKASINRCVIDALSDSLADGEDSHAAARQVPEWNDNSYRATLGLAYGRLINQISREPPANAVR